MKLLESDWTKIWQAYDKLCAVGLSSWLNDQQKEVLVDLIKGYQENGMEESNVIASREA